MKICISVLLFSALLLSGAFQIFAESSFDKEMGKNCDLLDEGKARQAIGRLLKLSESRELDEKMRGMVSLLLAKAYRLDGQNDKALETLAGIKTGRPEDYYIELGEANLLKNNYAEAISASDNYVRETNLSNLLYVLAMWVKARARFETEDYLDCMKCCRNIIEFNMKRQSEGALSEIELKNQKELEELKKKADELYEKARNLYDLKVYGEDYAWYRLGRAAEFAKKYDKAMTCYGKIKGGVLKDAGTCYTGHCLAELGEVKEALKTYADFYKSEPYGLYREEALYHAALLAYRSGTGEKSLAEAFDFSEKLLDCLKVIGESQRKIELAGINDALRRDVIDTAPQIFLRPDDCGNLIRTQMLPETINNRITAPWYLPYITAKARLLHGFLLGEKGDSLQAAEFYRQGASPEKIKVLSSPDTLPSLLAGLVDGFYLLPGECRNKIPKKYYNHMSLACFLFVSEERDAALDIFQNILDEDGIKTGSYVARAARLGIAYCLFSSKETELAEKMLSKFSSDSKKIRYEIDRQALYLHACILAGNPSEKEKAFGIFESLAKKEKGDKSDIPARSLLALAMAAINLGDQKKAEEAADLLQKEYSDTPYAEAAKTLKAALGKSRDGVRMKNLIPVVETKKGKVILHRRTMVVPSLTSIEPDTSELRAGDLIIYRIKCVARDPCVIVKGVKHELGENEPQIPQVNGNEIIFLRAPILYIKNLRYDFLNGPLAAK